MPPAWASRPIELPGKTGPTRASADLFDSCTNIRVGSAVLRDYYDSCSRTHSVTTLATPVDPGRIRTAAPEALRLCALRKYAADLGVDGFAEAVISYLPRQRVFGNANAFAPATAAGHPRQRLPVRGSPPQAPSRPRARWPAISPARRRIRIHPRARRPHRDTAPARLITPAAPPSWSEPGVSLE